MPDPHTAWPAWLLLGPTGAGKSPLGDLLQARGLDGRPCAHFDFGHRLRMADGDAHRAAAWGLTVDERAEIGRVLRAGALLERETFGIALKLFDAFTAGLTAGTRLIMNGLPRHVEQAGALHTRLDVEVVAQLECGAETVIERIRRNSGGDRGGRADDDPAAVRRRLDLYLRRTEALAAHYTARGARLLRIPVGPDDSAEGVLARLGQIGSDRNK
jgi:adenylate kinase